MIGTVNHPHPWIHTLATALAKIPGNEVHLLMMTGHVKADREFAHAGVHYHIVKSANAALKATTLFRANKWKMHRVLDRIAPDIVHGHSRMRESYFAVTSRYPDVITVHGQMARQYGGLGKKNGLKYAFARWKEYRVNRLMKYCIGVSQGCVDDCLRFLPKSNVFLVENPINEAF